MRIFISMMQKLKPGDSPNTSHRLTHSLNGRGITEVGERKTNLQRRNFPLMMPLIIRFLIRKSSLMRCNRTLNFHSCPGIRRIIAHHAQPLPSVQFHLQIMQVPPRARKPFPGTIHAARKARIFLCLKKQCPTLNSALPTPEGHKWRTNRKPSSSVCF